MGRKATAAGERRTVSWLSSTGVRSRGPLCYPTRDSTLKSAFSLTVRFRLSPVARTVTEPLLPEALSWMRLTSALLRPASLLAAPALRTSHPTARLRPPRRPQVALHRTGEHERPRLRCRGLPSPSRTFYVAAAAGGIWKTTNAGITFRPSSTNQRVISMGDLAIAPSDTQQVWARHRRAELAQLDLAGRRHLQVAPTAA